jgi:hypothetical protein
MSRFDSVVYDDNAKAQHEFLKQKFEELENAIINNLTFNDFSSQAMSYLEKSFLYIGKALAKEQLNRSQPKKTADSAGVVYEACPVKLSDLDADHCEACE